MTKTKDFDDFKRDIDEFIQQFGHFSDSGNDFSSVPWREKPDLVLKMILNHNPTEGKINKISYNELDIPLLRHPFLRFIYLRARQFRLYREQISSLYTFGYGLFRDYFLTLGNCFASRGIIENKEDIFYLYFDEIKKIINSSVNDYDFISLVKDRFYPEVIQDLSRKSQELRVISVKVTLLLFILPMESRRLTTP